jgi:putative serine protease PepD
MMTNSHVVGVNAAPGTQVQVNINGELRDATVVSNDSSRDVAQIRLSDSSGLTPVSVGSAPKAGDSLYSYGYANAQPNLTRVDATFTGETGRSTTYSDPGADLNGLRVNGLSVMQTTSASGLAPGMSGGPVFNSTGQLVGINAATTPGINRAKFVPI